MDVPVGSTSPGRIPGLRERRRQETRLDITRAALELFEQQGAAATTVDQIAHRAGLSSSTFFRYFATKEEPLYAADREFESELIGWLEQTPVEDIGLAGIESLHERSLRRLVTSGDDSRDRLLRTRRLILADDHLRAAAFAADALAMCRFTHRVGEKVQGVRSASYARLLLEAAGAAARTAFDVWVERVEAGDATADLVEIYRSTRAELRSIVADRGVPD